MIVWTLGFLGDSESRPVFLECLKSNDVALRTAGARALAHVADPDSFEAMQRVFQTELQNPNHNADLVRTLAGGLTRSDEHRAATALVSSLRLNPAADTRFNRDPRFGMLRMLGTLSVPLLIREATGVGSISLDGPFSQPDSTSYSRGAAVAVLASLAKDRLLLSTDEPLVIRTLAQQLNSPELTVRELVAEALSQSRSPAVTS